MGWKEDKIEYLKSANCYDIVIAMKELGKTYLELSTMLGKRGVYISTQILRAIFESDDAFIDPLRPFTRYVGDPAVDYY